MRNHFDPTLDPAAYDDCVLHSGDDHEPYGYVQPQMPALQMPALQLQALPPEIPVRRPEHDRVIEAQLLAHSSMVGC